MLIFTSECYHVKQENIEKTIVVRHGYQLQDCLLSCQDYAYIGLQVEKINLVDIDILSICITIVSKDYHRITTTFSAIKNTSCYNEKDNKYYSTIVSIARIQDK